jgi:hypothetical protein
MTAMTIKERIEYLERAESRRRRRLPALILCCILAGAGLGYIFPAFPRECGPSAEVRAGSFVLVDRSDRAVAVLELVDGAASLTLGDREGRARILLGADRNRPSMYVLDEHGTTILWLGENETGASVQISDTDGARRALIGTADRGPVLGLFTRDGMPGVELSLLADSPDIRIRDTGGALLWSPQVTK